MDVLKRTGFPWMLEVAKCPPQEAIIHLGEAFRNFFAGRSEDSKYRRKGADYRFTLSNAQFEAYRTRLRIPNIGWVRLSDRCDSSV